MSAPAVLQRKPGVGVALAAAGLAGVAVAARIFPADALNGTITLSHPVIGDTAQHIVGQRLFLADAWRWPLLVTRLAHPPGGVNIALTDSIPLAALAGKPFAALLPHGAHLVYGWVALCYVLQPVCAVLALRSAGVRGGAALLGGGVIALCLPAFIFRFGHAALCGQFTLLLALGLYFRLVAQPRWGWCAPCAALLLASLLIHPYLMAMATGILLGAPLSLLARREFRLAGRLAAILFVCLLPLGAAMVLGGYLGADAAGGFGYYSLNLLEPFVPTGSSLIPGFVLPDATGGQFEGYSYLGLGLAGLALVAAAQLRRAALRSWLLGHAGLLAAAAGAGAFAVSDKVYAGHRLLLALDLAPHVLRQFRASGRFVWVDLYVLLVLAGALAWMGLGRRAAPILLALAALQFADTRSLRGQVAAQIVRPAAWAVDPAFYRPLLASHRRLTLWPTAACDAGLVTDPVFMHLLLLASEVALPVNTMPTARATGPDDGCDAATPTGALQPGELRLLLPGTSPNLVAGVPGLQGRCHGLPGGITACTDGRSLDGTQVVRPAPFLLGPPLSLGRPDGAALAGLGWTQASPDGAWTIGPRATLLGSVPPGTGRLRLSIVAHGIAPAGLAQTVQVEAGGQIVATWAVTQGADQRYDAILPPPSDGQLAITFAITHPVRPQDVLANGDTRPLGLFLRSFRLTQADSAP